MTTRVASLAALEGRLVRSEEEAGAAVEEGDQRAREALALAARNQRQLGAIRSNQKP